jgi:hypothetical protein
MRKACFLIELLLSSGRKSVRILGPAAASDVHFKSRTLAGAINSALPSSSCQEMDACIEFTRKLFASHEIKVLPSRDRAVANRLLLATGRFHDVIANKIQ